MSFASYLSIHDLKTINYQLKKDELDLNRIGKLTKEGTWNHIFNGLTLRSQPRLLVLVEKLNQTFAHLEQKGIKIFDPKIVNKEFLEKKHHYQATHQIYLDTAKGLVTHLEKLKKLNPELKQAFDELQCRAQGLKYGLGEDNGGLNALNNPDEDCFKKVQELAVKWKKNQKLAVDQELNVLELGQLAELAKYPEWLKVVFQNPAYLSEVFGWCLRDYNQVEVIVKCFETRRRLKVALLSANLGYVRNLDTKPEDEVLAFRKVSTKTANVSKRILTIPVYDGSFTKFEPSKQKRFNILKPTENIHFQKGNYYLTVEELLYEIGQKNERESNVNLCADWGFINFHPVKGVWNADTKCYELPKLTKKNWTDNVPPSRIVSHEELVKQYGEKKMKDRQFFFKVMATRQNLDLTALECHAFWQFYVRMQDGNWRVLNVGSYAYRFQRGLLDGLSLFCNTVRRVACLMDQNGYYTLRQRGGFPVFPNKDQADATITSVHELLASKKVFQFTGRNCAYPIQKIVHRIYGNLPNFYRMPISRTKTGIGPLDRLLAWSHRKLKWIRWLVVSFLHSTLCSHRSLKIKKPTGSKNYSVKEYLSKKGHIIHNPGYLPHQIAEAKKTNKGPFVNGELIWSHSEEKMYQKKVLDEKSVVKDKLDFMINKI